MGDRVTRHRPKQLIYVLFEERGTYDNWEKTVHGVTADLRRADDWKASGAEYVGDYDSDVPGHRYYEIFTIDSFTNWIAKPPTWWVG